MATIINRLMAVAVSAVLAYTALGCSDATANETPANTGQTAETTQTDDTADADSEEWKNNLGSITLSDDGTTYEGEGISIDGNTVLITAGGDYTLTGTLTDGMIHVNTTEKVKLRLDGVSISNSSGPAIFFEDSKKSFITLSEGSTNTLTDGSSYTVDAKGTIFSNDTLEIKGGGTLNITGNSQHAIASDDDIIIEEGSINILAAATDGLHANDDITISGGSIDIANCNEGMESEATININGGSIRISATDDPINAGTDITINDGYIFAQGGGDGIDANGSLTINGGTTIAYGGINGEGPVDAATSFTVNGGTVIAGGGNMGITLSEESEQYGVWIGANMAADTLVNISGGAADETFALQQQVSLVFYSSDKLAANTEYSVSTGGSSTGTETDGLYTGGAYSGGSQLGSFTTNAKSSSLGNMSMGGGMGGGGTRPEGGGGGRPGTEAQPNQGADTI